MRHLTPTDYTCMPWKNGGGTTTEVLIHPPRARLDDGFVYRVSIADVASSGPFSAFPGCERHLMLVAGAGMTLTLPDRSLELRLYEPVTFSGDDPAHGTLHGGAVRDLNLIVNRTRARASLEHVVVNAPIQLACEPGDTCIVHVLEGELDVASQGDTLIAETRLDVVPRGELARLAVARVHVGVAPG